MDSVEYNLRWPAVGGIDYQWHPSHPVSIAYRHQFERVATPMLRTIPGFPELDVLDIGCGAGWKVRWMADLMIPPERVHGLDMNVERIRVAEAVNPAIDVRVGDATDLPWADDSFDLVTQIVTFSTIPAELRQQAAAELLRVLRPGGWVLWYDVARRDPGAVPDGIPVEDLDDLLPGVEWLTLRRLHHRFLARTSTWPANGALERLLPRTNLIRLGVRR